MKKLITTAVFTMALYTASMAQEPGFNQQFAQSVFSNPAMACNEGYSKFTLGYKSWYANLTAPVRDMAGAYEFCAPGKTAGFAIMLNRSEADNRKVALTSIGAAYNYRLKFSKDLHMNFGLQAAMRQKTFNLSNALFEDMFDPYNGAVYPTGENFESQRKNYISAGLGFFLYSSKFSLGLSALNVNKPNTALLGNNSISEQPMSIKGVATYAFKTGENNYAIPHLSYNKTGLFSEINGGLTFRNNQVNFGLGYSTYSYKGSAVLLNLGVVQNGFKLGYGLGMGINADAKQGGMTHEITLGILLNDGKKEPNKPVPALPFF